MLLKSTGQIKGQMDPLLCITLIISNIDWKCTSWIIAQIDNRDNIQLLDYSITWNFTIQPFTPIFTWHVFRQIWLISLNQFKTRSHKIEKLAYHFFSNPLYNFPFQWIVYFLINGAQTTSMTLWLCIFTYDYGTRITTCKSTCNLQILSNWAWQKYQSISVSNYKDGSSLFSFNSVCILNIFLQMQ